MESELRRGYLLTLLGVLAVCPDALLVRLAEAPVWTVTFWRGLLMALGLGLGLLAVLGPRRAGAITLAIGAAGLLAAGCIALTGGALVYAITHTTAANALLIFATAPLFAALFTRLFLREAVPRRTWLAITAALLGIAVIVSGSIGQSDLEGDLAAVVAAAGLAGAFTLYRAYRRRNMIPAVALGGLLLVAVSLLLGDPGAVAPERFAWLLLLGLLLTLSFGLITLGARLIPPSDTSLLMLLEVVLAPLLVWMVLAEQPTPRAFLGGGIVVGALLLHALVQRRAAARTSPREAPLSPPLETEGAPGIAARAAAPKLP